MSKRETPLSLLGILGSPRRDGKTEKLLRYVIDFAQEEGARSEVIYLLDNPPRYCIGCYSDDPKLCNFNVCTTGDLDDGMKSILQKFLHSDAIIFATPVYWFSPSALLKTLIERLTSLENVGKMLDGKVAGLLATYEEDGATMALLSLVGALLEMGFLFPPYSLVFTSKDPDIDPVVIEDARRLAKNVLKLASFQRKNPRNWWRAQDM
jgi:multimeric flavodoxin WrbA